MNFELERTPSAPYDSESEERTGDWLFGEQYSWGAKVRAMYQALAAPKSGVAFPVPPTADDYVFAACSYWALLVHLLAYSLGWARPNLGMRWWYDADKPVDDLRLSLIAELWDTDGFLDWFSAWLWSGSTGFPERLQEFMSRPAEGGCVAVDQDWLWSWHVDVYARPVGWLGTYRRSRQTGLWFAGAHSLHMRGNEG